MGAWIETVFFNREYRYVASHPSWVRGLKQNNEGQDLLPNQSHPSWVRGLKLRILKMSMIDIRRTPRGCVD